MHVVVNVTLEDILLYIIIVFIVPSLVIFFLRSGCHYYV